MADFDVDNLSKKLDVVISLLLHIALKDGQFNGGKHKTGDLAVWLKGCGLSNTDISTILGSSPGSISVLLHLKSNTKKKKKK